MAEIATSSGATSPWLYIQVYANPKSAQEEGATPYHWVYLLDQCTQSKRTHTLYHVCWKIDEDIKARLGYPWMEKLKMIETADRPIVWQYERRPLDSTRRSHNTKGRIRLCQVSNVAGFEGVLESIYVDSYWNDTSGFRCQTWMEDAWAALTAEEGLLEPVMGAPWLGIKTTLEAFLERVEKKKRFDYEGDDETVPTWDLIKEEETVS